MSTREDHIQFMLDLGKGWTRDALEQWTDGDLAWSYENQRRDGGPRTVARVDGRDDDLDRRVNEEVARRMGIRRGQHHDAPVFEHVDAELAALVRNFDDAPQYLEDYHNADPWLHGEVAAMNAANEARGGKRGFR